MTEAQALAQLCLSGGPKMARAILSGNPLKNLADSGYLRGLLRKHRRLAGDEISRLIQPMLSGDRAGASPENTIHTLRIIAAYQQKGPLNG